MLFGRPQFRAVALEVLRQKELKAKKTREAAHLHIGRLIRNFGNVPVRLINEKRWSAYIALEYSRKKRTFYDDRKYMKMILLYAHRNGLIERVPQLQIPDAPWEAGREILPEELERLERAAQPTMRFQIRIGWKMGLRLREMMRLRWDQFDWEQYTIAFRARDTKTRRGRVIPITPDLIPVFLERKARSESPFVFPNPNHAGRPQDSNKGAWQRLRARCGVKARWHDLRHTCATVMLRRGVPIHLVRQYLGMSETVLTRIYLHLSVEDLRRAAEEMSDLPASKGRRG